jgi:uncharacterized membrane protein YdjX (TVP38/TMEM64 family)
MPIESTRERWTPVVIASLLLTVVGMSQLLRTQLGISPSMEAVGAWTRELGWRAPVAFVGLVTVRQLLLLPAALLLTAGGLVFGSGLGTALGGTGIVCSALVNFSLARRLGVAVWPGRLGDQIRRWSSHGQAPLLAFIAVVTAHPFGPMILGQWTAGCSALRLSRFFAVIAPTSYVRAATLATFGASLPAWGSPASIVMTVLLGAAIALPLASPSFRRRLAELQILRPTSPRA